MTVFSLDSQENPFNPLYGTQLGLGCSLLYIKVKIASSVNVKPKKEASHENNNNHSQNFQYGGGCVVGIRPIKKYFTRGFVNIMEVRFIQL